MKEIRTIKMVEVTDVRFVADDGKEFVGLNAERDCRDYERQQNKYKIDEEFKRLDIIKMNLPLEWFSKDIWKVEFETKKDYFRFADYFEVHYGNCEVDMPTEFPCTKLIAVYDDNYVTDYYGDIESIKKALQKVLENLE